jgi:nitrogen regulatory protein PII 2
MKEILAVIRINMMNQTKRALSDAGISSITAREALGRGKGLVDLHLLKGAERGYEEAIAQLGQSHRLIPKRAILVVVPDGLVDKVVKTIIRVNKTGKSGDGMIFVLPCLDAIRVRTGEHGDDVLDDVIRKPQ